jgi:hypothetical protein
LKSAVCMVRVYFAAARTVGQDEAGGPLTVRELARSLVLTVMIKCYDLGWPMWRPLVKVTMLRERDVLEV